MTGDEPTASSHAQAVPGHVLVVEDSMIIALDTEDCLRELGVEKVAICGTVTQALETIEQGAPDFAVLDYSLGQETSEAVAHELARRGIPFWLATGYDEMGERKRELGAGGVLTKPFGKREIAAMLAELTAAEEAGRRPDSGLRA